MLELVALILAGHIIFDIPGEPCTGTLKTRFWTTPVAINIAQIQIWNGLDFGQVSDVVENVQRQSDGTFLINANHDDYTNGTGNTRIQKENWGGNVFPLAAGETLGFQYLCSPAIGHGAWNVTIWTVP